MTERRKTAVVTGATRGLGLEIATMLTDSGWDLVLPTRRPDFCAHTFPKARVVLCDLAAPDTIAETLKPLPMVDALINCAAIRNTGPFKSRKMDDLMAQIMVNLVSPLALVHGCWPGLKAAKGIIVDINSIASEEPGNGESVYAATKAGLRGFSKALQFDAVADGVQEVSVFLGAMKTDMTKGRSDHAQLISPFEAALTIIQQIENKKESCRVTEIKILRSRYS